MTQHKSSHIRTGPDSARRMPAPLCRTIAIMTLTGFGTIEQQKEAGRVDKVEPNGSDA